MNLLTDDLLRVQTDKGMERMSLPALMAALGQDRVHALPGLQRHQEDAFHVFLCCLAGAILARKGGTDPEQTTDEWCQGLQMLAGPDAELAWTLVVADPTQPAFMQPPVIPEADVKRLKTRASSADQLDLLPTAKNHDVKAARAASAEVDEWIYALISLQTMSGYYGSGNQGISRMNKGNGSRVVAEVLHTDTPGGRFRDAVIRLLDWRWQVLDGSWGYDPQGVVLVWVLPWDGKTSVALSRLDPFYIEVCRRVRLHGNGRIERADVVPADAPRIDAKALKGNVGDPWIPIDRTKEAALTPGPAGLTPELLRRLVFADQIQLTPLHKPIPERAGPVWFTISVLVRGQGTTEGFHSVTIPISPQIRRRLFGGAQERDMLAALAKAGIEAAGVMQNRVLKPALFAYAEGAPEQLKFDRDAVSGWWETVARRFTDLWSETYFPWLWSAAEHGDDAIARRIWIERLRDYAVAELRQIMDEWPAHTGRYYRVRTRAEARFYGALYRQFPLLKETSNVTIS